MILEIDCGNTLIKWRLLNLSLACLDSGVALTGQNEDFTETLPRDISPKQIFVSSVASAESNKQLSARLLKKYKLKPQFAKSEKASGLLVNGYFDAEVLGVDRWLAMLAAYNIAKSAVCVVDCGTALTIDFVSQDGCHTGGYILPGLQTIKASLFANTAAIAQEYSDLGRAVQSLKVGRTTAEAVDHGRVLMLVAAIERAIVENPFEGLNVFLTGGDGRFLLDYLSPILNTAYLPDLVLDGLGVLFSYRTN